MRITEYGSKRPTVPRNLRHLSLSHEASSEHHALGKPQSAQATDSAKSSRCGPSLPAHSESHEDVLNVSTLNAYSIVSNDEGAIL